MSRSSPELAAKARAKRGAFRAAWLAALVALGACATVPPGEPGRALPAAERIFHADPRWLGGDAAISVPLGGGRILWLFGDSFVDPAAPHLRAEAAFVRNAIAIQTGADPLTASMAFAWGADGQGAPASFFPDEGDTWFWPGDGIRLDDGSLAILLHRMAATEDDTPLGFAARGYALALIANPDAPPADWRMRIVPGPATPLDLVPGAALVRDGAHVVALAVRTNGHAGAFVRWPAQALARGDLSGAEWWAGEAWTAQAALTDAPAFVISDAGTESSIHWSGCRFVHVASRGFGATDIVMRTAPALIGPWTAPRAVYTPPESSAADAFVYAGKAHPDLTLAEDRLAITYVANSFDQDALLTPQGQAALYWPRMAEIPNEPCPAAR